MMDNQILQEVEDFLLPKSFQLLPELSQWQNVYARIIHWNRKNVSQRVYAPIHEVDGVWKWMRHPHFHESLMDFTVSYAVRDRAQGVIKIGSERRVKVSKRTSTWRSHLLSIITNYKVVITLVDEPCDRCELGVYRYETKKRGVMQAICFRCGGKGYLDYDDRIRNRIYDEKHA